MNALILFSIFAFSPTIFAVGPSCETQSLKNSIHIQSDARSFHKQYDLNYVAQQKAIAEFRSQSKLDKSKANEEYFESLAGQKSLMNSQQIKKSFGYDAISAFLFDDKDMNDDVEFYDQIVKEGKKTYYVDGQRIIATLEPDGTNSVLTRFDKNCEIKEIVQFNSVRADSDTQVDFKINEVACRLSQKGKKNLSEDNV